MSNFPALEVVIGLCFVYFVLSLICSAVTESIASLKGWRAAKLELGIKNLLSGSDTVTKEGEALAKQVYDHPLVQALVRPKTGKKAGKRPPWPSYIPSRTFISALLDIGASQSLGDKSGVDMAVVDVDVQKAIAAIPSAKVQEALLALYRDSKGDVESFRRHAEQWFDDSMQTRLRLVSAARLDRPLGGRCARRRVPERRHAARRQHAVDRPGRAGGDRRACRQGGAAGTRIAERDEDREQHRASARLEAVQARRRSAGDPEHRDRDPREDHRARAHRRRALARSAVLVRPSQSVRPCQRHRPAAADGGQRAATEQG